MRKPIKEFVGIVSRTLPIKEPVYEFGSLQTKGQEAFADMRPFFKGKKYVGTDFRKGKGVDIALDLHKIKLPDKSVGTALVLETLEHVEYPSKAMNEIFRVLKPNGMVVATSLMKFPIHNHPYDYWRFTPEAFKSLLKKFHHSYVDFAGEESFPHTIIGLGFKGLRPNLRKFKRDVGQWKKKWRKDAIHALFVERLMAKFVPSFLIKFYLKTWPRRN